MFTFLGIIIGILIPSLWIFLPLRRVPEEYRIKKSKYVVSIVVGATLCTLLIIILESIFDIFSGIDVLSVTTLPQALTVSFLRAGLLEEFAKYVFVRGAIKRVKPQGKLQYMLLAGTIGMGYGITEKLVMGSAVSMLIDAVFALHIMYQFLMGMYLYESEHAEDASKKRSFGIKAFLVPYVLHSLWDSIQFGANTFVTSEMTVSAVIAVVLLIAEVIAALVCEVKMMGYLKKVEV